MEAQNNAGGFSMKKGKEEKVRKASGITVKKIAFVGIFGAISAILMAFSFPLPIAPSFYELDFSEVPALIGTFAFGPIAGMLIEVIKNLVHLLIQGTHTAGVGEFANVIIGWSFLIPAGIIYGFRKNRKNAIVGMVVGTIVMAVVGATINALVLLPAYAAAFHMPIDALVGMGSAVNAKVTNLATFAVLCVAPFNVIKGVVVSIVTFVLYKRVSTLIHKAGEH